ncbi:N-acyl homoserine lactonase family protein [Frankia sp. Cppng1_Ct_nod]|uniref:N-acyl homoserine lactonase family protein n=1 Tax=Frankia sp. Cppng1_Ct_nod TaxID=2897162 RepID=UPI0010414211|nr:N-acyl homoserine lactonase family protein [Frankia sp. Cppng1_Ct_nod]
MAGVRRVIPLTLGWAEVPYSMSVYGAADDVRLREPVPALLLEVDGGWLLIDTGFNPAFVRDPALCRRFHRDTGVEVWLPAGDADPLEAELDRVGLALDRLDAVAVSHLHNDHAGGLRHFSGRQTPVHIQRRELDHGLGTHPADLEADGIIRVDFDHPRIAWQVADGDTEIAPGVTAVLTAGHTPGHQSFVVELDPSVGGGGYVFAFDAADLQENIDEERAVGGSIGVSPEATVEPIRRLKAIASARGLRLVPGHDPVAWPALTTQLGAPPARDPLRDPLPDR